MIPITLSQALAIYGGLLLFLAVAVWWYTETTTRTRYRALQQQFLWRCVFCGYTYLDETAEDISKCPRCKSLNALADKRARFAASHYKDQSKVRPITPDNDMRRNPSLRKRPHQRRRGPRRRPR